MYQGSKGRGRGLTSCKTYVWGEENSLDWYVENCNVVLLRKVWKRETLKTNKAKEPRVHKNARQPIERKGNAWAVTMFETWREWTG